MRTAPIHLALQKALYTLKDGAKTSYKKHYGCSVLPERISYIPYPNPNSITRASGGKTHRIAGRIHAEFKRSERSPLMKHCPYALTAHIWHIDNYPRIIGYGHVWISDPTGHTRDSNSTQDLIVLVSPDNSREHIAIYYFEGMSSHAEKFVAYFDSHV